MEELGTPSKLMDERMGHEDGSVQAVYSHITPEMRRNLLAGLARLWEAALDERRALSPGSPVDVLDRLLRQRPAVNVEIREDRLPGFSPEASSGGSNNAVNGDA